MWCVDVWTDGKWVTVDRLPAWIYAAVVAKRLFDDGKVALINHRH